ncbi:MAG: putative integral rane protein [Bryobacterales bacterium]|nr:putative integral rane protein [Bryobacterales bacterium]
MILPTTASTVWILAIVSLLCLGSWANTLKLAGKWRFEYFYYDFVFGILLGAGAAALLLGSAHPQELTFQDNLLLTGYRKMAWALGSGVVLNLGTLLLLAAMSLSGMSVAFPLTLGVALVIGTVWDFATATQASTPLAFGGVVLLLAAVIVIALTHVWRLRDQQQAAQTALRPDPRVKPQRARAPGAGLAIILAVFGGIALSTFPRILGEATSGENGMAPYAAMLLLAISAFLTAPFFVLFFTTFPVAGAAGSLRGYLGGTKIQHLLGLLGGILWATGMLSSLLIAGAPRDAQPSALIQYALSHGTLLVAAVWGLLVWREFRGAGDRVRMLLAGMLVLFLAGLGVVAFAFSTK